MPQIKHAESGKCLKLNSTPLHIWDCVDGDPTQLFAFDNTQRIFVQADSRLMCLDQDSTRLQARFERDDCTSARDRKYRLTAL